MTDSSSPSLTSSNITMKLAGHPARSSPSTPRPSAAMLLSDSSLADTFCRVWLWGWGWVWGALTHEMKRRGSSSTRSKHKLHQLPPVAGESHLCHSRRVDLLSQVLGARCRQPHGRCLLPGGFVVAVQRGCTAACGCGNCEAPPVLGCEEVAHRLVGT